ncbi:alpha/beta hydrolase [Corynebacterium kozikiae]|uniref:alpha/beta hydrolase n=1 Tax=Corynebacterium kozikiae TaxID=2968469 RepID=UPI00211CE74D|nr:alpha/beta hydrolase [Corynebacterium sp. 76QC2CO]MCQ9342394.1 alpha/beta hydrolase [Corynebacterium sp. 76QC2CO]
MDLADHNLTWRPDILGADYACTTLELRTSPQDLGPLTEPSAARAVLVRHRPAALDAPAVLWIHGMTDYFFHTHVAEHLHALGYATYGIDLRRCGRAHREGQLWHYTADVDVYFEELTQALEIILATHPTVVPIGHSTGGLIAARWVAWLREHRPELHAHIPSLVLNSPWLDMHGPTLGVRASIPVVLSVGKRNPGRLLPIGRSEFYGRSLHKDHQGQWEYDLTLKPLGGHKKYFGWLRSVILAQEGIHRGAVDCEVPVLTLCSDRSIDSKTTNSATPHTHGDAVLDTLQIRSRSPMLSHSVRVEAIRNAGHDVFLSDPEPLRQAFAHLDRWLAATAPEPNNPQKGLPQ